MKERRVESKNGSRGDGEKRRGERMKERVTSWERRGDE